MIVNGEQALIAINTGLNNQLTGIENIELKGALLGLRPQRVREIIDGVAEFSEIGEFPLSAGEEILQRDEIAIGLFYQFMFGSRYPDHR